ncbi:glycerophosphodiester phosphodiesterase [Clostridium felsineum]|uniref:glycerophosphodiester phosphodiesterase family protein n=1 Tax=Clostridium felsineum TaxID=36839 RepID=UPI00214DE119|nr:glycerophosphodiester phosphodiesterase family protein [Clostridium felsineum]MCR3761179.1 glycerophosphodiester phosphodiesterase [Clostridium felsineum]
MFSKKFKFISVIISIIVLLSLYNKICSHENTSYNNIYLTSNVHATKIIAHRANYFNEPENSVLGIKDCINYKVDYAEIDVQETKDGVVVLMHDKNLRRLTGLNKNVDELTYKKLKSLNLRRHFFRSTTEKIPTLQQAINQSRGKLNLIIEIKPYGNTDDLLKKVVIIMEKNHITKGSMIHSCDYSILEKVRKLDPNISTGYILSSPFTNISYMNVNFFSVRKNLLSPRLVKILHKSKKQIFVWTLDNKKAMIKASSLHVDGIITDTPDLLKATLKKPDKEFI